MDFVSLSKPFGYTLLHVQHLPNITGSELIPDGEIKAKGRHADDLVKTCEEGIAAAKQAEQGE